MKIIRKGNSVSISGGSFTGEQLRQIMAGHTIPLAKKPPDEEAKERQRAELHHAMRNAGVYRDVEKQDLSICGEKR
jgi:hypothetical protein